MTEHAHRLYFTDVGDLCCTRCLLLLIQGEYQIDRENQTVTDSDGEVISYESLC